MLQKVARAAQYAKKMIRNATMEVMIAQTGVTWQPGSSGSGSGT
jgi:hypothetical protein